MTYLALGRLLGGPLRLALAQGWLFHHGLEDAEAAEELAALPSSSSHWEELASETLDALAEKWSFFDYRGQWGVVDQSHLYSVGDELIYFAMIEGTPPGEPVHFEADTTLGVLPLLMHWTGEDGSASPWGAAGSGESAGRARAPILRGGRSPLPARSSPR